MASTTTALTLANLAVIPRGDLKKLVLEALGGAPNKGNTKSGVTAGKSSASSKSSPRWVSEVKKRGSFPDRVKSRVKSRATPPTGEQRRIAIRVQVGGVVAVAEYKYSFKTDTKGDRQVTLAERTSGSLSAECAEELSVILPKVIKLKVSWNTRDVDVLDTPSGFFVTVSRIPAGMAALEPGVADKETEGRDAFAAIYHSLPDDSLSLEQRMMMP